jgi:hypothetical protein
MTMDAEGLRGLVDARVVGEPRAHRLDEARPVGGVVRAAARAARRRAPRRGGVEARQARATSSAKRAVLAAARLAAARACAWPRANLA